MSTPTRELEELNIGGDMNQGRASRDSTRSQGDPEDRSSQSSQASRRSRARGPPNPVRSRAQKRRRAEEAQRKVEQQIQQQQFPPLAPAPPGGRGQPMPPHGAVETDLIHGNFGIFYRGRNLTPRSRETAEQSLVDRDRFLIEHSRRLEGYVAFQLCSGTASVRISSPGTPGPRVRCTCELYRRSEGSVVCEHIYWLYARLREEFRGAQHPGILPTDRESIDQFMAQLYAYIDRDIEDLPTKLQRAIWDDGDEEERQDQEDELLLSDIIAFLDKKRLWSKDIDELPTPALVRSGRFDDLPVAGDPLATISNLFRHDRIFRDRMRIAVTRDMCVDDLLAKLQERAQSVLRRFDQDAADEATRQPEVVTARADELRDVIERLGDYGEHLHNIGNGGASAAFHNGAAQLAVAILRRVAARDSLFANLVRTPPPAVAGTDFVLEFLLDIPPADLAALTPQLEPLVQLLREHRAPRAYVDILQEILQSIREGASEEPTSGAGATRPRLAQPQSTSRAQSSGQTVPARRTFSGDVGGGRQQKRQQQRRPSK